MENKAGESERAYPVCKARPLLLPSLHKPIAEHEREFPHYMGQSSEIRYRLFYLRFALDICRVYDFRKEIHGPQPSGHKNRRRLLA